MITLPLGVLQAGRVAFSPGLGRKQTVIDRLGWGHVARLTLRFRAGFWSRAWVPAALRARRGRAFGFLNAPGEAVPTWWALTPPEPVLTGWAGGEAALPLIRLAPAQRLRAAVASLAHIFDTSRRTVRAGLEDWQEHDWSGDPQTMGAYSYAKAGFESGPEQLARPLANTLFFAGEATAAELGTVHGALESGLRAAREIRLK